MDSSLRDELVAMDDFDQAVRAELAADGSLFEGYHPRMEAVHRANAARLRAIIAEHGWPGIPLVGERGAASAWRIAQHSIGEPEFMRLCRDLIGAAAERGDAPRWQFAFIDDRIRIYEGRPQRYGTQLRCGLNRLEPYPLEDAVRVEGWRKELGLPPLEVVIAQSPADPPPKAIAQATKDEAELLWRRKVGWLA